MIVAAEIPDGVFSVVVAVALTTMIALQGWQVKLALDVKTSNAVNASRLDNVESRMRWWDEHLWQRPSPGAARGGLVLVVAAFCIAILWSALWLDARREDRDEQAACQFRQEQYDGHFVFAAYLGDQFGATQEQIAAGLADLEEVLGPRPEC